MTAGRLVLAVLFFTGIILGLLITAGTGGVSSGKPLIDSERTKDPEFQSLSKTLAHFIMGEIYDNLGETEEAVSEYERALDVRQDIADVHMKLGADLMMLGKLDEAAGRLGNAIALDPGDHRKRLLLGIVYTTKEEYDKAEAEYRKVLEEDPENFRALAFLSDLYVLRKDFTGAAAIYEKMLAINQNDAFLYFNLGIIYSKTDQLAKAAENLKKALEIDKDYLEAQMVLGFVYEVQGDLSQAQKAYEAVIENDPGNKEARTRLGHLCFRLGKTEEAVECIRGAMEFEPASPEPYLKIFSIYVLRGKVGEARRTLEEGIEKGIDAGGAFYASLGYLDILEKKYGQAIENYSRALQEEPANGLYRFYLGIATDRTGDRKKAIQIMEECVAAGDATAEVYNYLGYLYAEEGKKLDRAIELIGRALELDPTNGAYLDSMGWAYYKKGMLAEAFAYIVKASEAMPDDADVAEHLGDIYFALGDTANAHKAWSKALELNPAKNGGLAEKIRKVPAPEEAVQGAAAAR